MYYHLTLGAALLLPTFAYAAATSTSIQFETGAPQGLFSWGPDYKILDREFIGISDGRAGETDLPQWNFDGDINLGGILSAGGHSRGRVGLELDLSVDAGSLKKAIVPYDAGFQYTYADFATNNFTSLTPFATLGNNAYLETTSPDFEFKADLVFEVQNQVRAGACIDFFVTSACGSFSTGDALNIPKQTLTLLEVAPDPLNNNVIKAELLPALQAIIDQAKPYVDAAKTGKNVADAITSAGARNPNTGELLSKTKRTELALDALFDVGVSSGPLASAEIRLPELGNTGAIVGDVIQSGPASDDFLSINVDVDNTLTSLGILPIPLELQLVIDAGIAEAGIHGSLVDIDINADFGINQQVTISPTLTMDLAIQYADGSGVTIKKNGIELANQTDVSLLVGTDLFEVKWQGGDELLTGKGALMVTPTFKLDAEILTENELFLDLNLNLDALSARLWFEVAGINLFDETLGPLFSYNIPLANESLGSQSDSFSLSGFQSFIQGETFAFLPAATTFANVSGLNADWVNPALWSNGVGDDGNAVEINGVVNIRSGESFDVGNVVNNAGGIFIFPNASLVQMAGAAVTTFQNNTLVRMSGNLALAAPLTGGGRIEMLSGSVLSGTIDLNGQHIDGRGTINASGTFDVDGVSSVIAKTGALNLNLTNIISTKKIGEIGVDGPHTLNWTSTNAALLYTVDNLDALGLRDGTIRAVNGGTINLSHDGTGAADVFRIRGGRIETDATSFMHAPGTLWLDGSLRAVTANANIGGPNGASPVGTLALSDAIINNGEIYATNVRIGIPLPGAPARNAVLEGSGRLNLVGGNLQAAALNKLSPFASFVNSADHEITGTGTIGNRLSGSAGQSVPLAIQNEGLIAAGASNIPYGTLNLETSASIAAVFDNNGTLQGGWSRPGPPGGGSERIDGKLVLDNGLFDLADGTVHARYGEVVLSPNARTVGGTSDGGPGGIWHAGNALGALGDINGIQLQNAAVQWSQLLSGILDNAEITLEGRQAYFTLNGNTLEDRLGIILPNGKLTLIDRDFNRGGEIFQFFVGGQLELGGNAQFFTGLPNSANANDFGTTLVSAGTISGDGRIISNIQLDRGTISTAGYGGTFGNIPNNITIVGDVFGLRVGPQLRTGTFEVAGGARMSLFIGQCDITPGGCPFASDRLISAGTISGAQISLTSDETQTTDSRLHVSFIPSASEPYLFQLTENSRVELNGVRTRIISRNEISANIFKTLEETLRIVDDSELVLGNGRVFNSLQPKLTFRNGSILRLNDGGTALTGGPTLGVEFESGSGTQLIGGSLEVGTILMDETATIAGFGKLSTGGVLPSGYSFINGGGRIVANDGELDIANSLLLNKDTTSGLGGVLSAEQTFSTRDAPSILRLTDTSVTGGQIGVGRGSLLAGNGTLLGVAVNNEGTILVDGGTGASAMAFQNDPDTGTGSSLVNRQKSQVVVSKGRLLFEDMTVGNVIAFGTDRPRIEAITSEVSTGDSVIQLSNANINNGELLLTSALDLSTGLADSRAILEGYGTLSNVELTVGAGSLVDANVSGETLKINFGADSITNLGVMQASKAIGLPAGAPGGVLELAGGNFNGTGEVIARDASTVILRNVNFNGVSLSTIDSGKVIDVATSNFSRLGNHGTFDVEGHATLRGSVNNAGGTISVKSGGVVTISEGGTQFIGTPPDDLIPNGLQPFAIDGGAIGGRLIVDTGGRVEGIGANRALNMNDATLTLNGGTVAGSVTEITVNGNMGSLEGTGVVEGFVTNNATVKVKNLTVLRLENFGAVVVDPTSGAPSHLNGVVFNKAGGTISSQDSQELVITSKFNANNNQGDIRSFNGGKIKFQGRLTNFAGGLIQLNSGWIEFSSGLASGDLINNGGTLLVAEGGGNMLFGDINNMLNSEITLTGISHTTFADSLVNNGLLEVQTGSIAVFAGNVTGSGMYAGLGSKFFEDGFSPGSSPGLVLSEGDTTFGSGASIEMEIAGLELGDLYDHYRVGGKLDLGGTLNIKLLDGFAPGEGDEFDLFDALEFGGGFASLNFDDAALTAGLRWNFSQLNSSGVLSVSAVPLPAGVWLMLSALAGLGAMRRQRAAA